MRLLDPLAADLAQWRLATAQPADHLPVVPGQNDDAAWTAEGFNKWRQRNFGDALRAVGLEGVRPYDLRHSFASLLLHEGRSVIYVARQLGHGANLTMGTYGHVIDELEEAPNLPAEDAIRRAREEIRTRLVPFGGATADRPGSTKRPFAGLPSAPRAGFEPAAYSLGGSRSIRLSYRGSRAA